MNTIEEQAVVHNTFVVERAYAVLPERVFAAFSDPAKNGAGMPTPKINRSKVMAWTFASAARNTTLSVLRTAIRWQV